jgi:3-deoxy-D-manno-octulosonic-acid transferase
VANVAVLGGGFGAGIHNVLEPAAYGVPIWVGPNCSRFLEAQLLRSQGGLEVVNSEASLTLAIEEVLANPAELRRRGLQAQSFVKANAGAADCIADGLSHL